MKRTAIKRKTPLRSKSQLKHKTGLRPISKKKQKQNDRMRIPRQRYREIKPCAVCGEETEDVHEIARGPSRDQAFVDPDTWLSLCRCCHDKLGDFSEWPIARQIALKIKVVMDAVNGARSGRAQTSFEEIEPYLQEFVG